jgi:hypothetical protein
MDAAIHFAAFHPDVVQNPNPDSVFLPSKLGAFAFYEAPKPGENIFSHMLLREWTPGNEFFPSFLFRCSLKKTSDTRVFDFTLCDTHGSVICTMHDFELREVSSTPKTGVTTRYDLIYQPISMKLGLSRPNGNAVAHEVNDLQDLLNVLDHFALDFLSNLLRENLRQTDKVRHDKKTVSVCLLIWSHSYITNATLNLRKRPLQGELPIFLHLLKSRASDHDGLCASK